MADRARRHPAAAVAGLCVLFAAGAPAAAIPHESFWGAQELTTARGHLRYLLLVPPGYRPGRPCELWVNLHGDPGCASHAVFQYRLQAARRGVFLLAPQATGDTAEPYVRPDGKRDVYRFWDRHRDPARVMEQIADVERRYPIDAGRVALLGFSAGCEMGWRLLALRPDTFCFFGGVANRFRRGRMPASEGALRRAARHVPMFYGAGQDDGFSAPWYRVTVRKLRACGFELRTVFAPHVGHALPPTIQDPLVAFLDEVRARPRPPVPVPARRAAAPAPRGDQIAVLAVPGGVLALGAAVVSLRRRR